MKKIILSALIISSFSITSCEEDENITNEFAGLWVPVKTSVNGVETDYQGHASCGKDALLLNEFSSFEMKDFQDQEVFNPNTNQVETTCEGKTTTGSYRIISGVITFYGGNFFNGGEITVNGNQLTIKTLSDIDADGTVDEIINVFQK